MERGGSLMAVQSSPAPAPAPAVGPRKRNRSGTDDGALRPARQAEPRKGCRPTWDQYFSAAAEYTKQYGHLNVPQRYVSPAGLKLGQWIGTQRRVYAGRVKGRLSQQQIARLEAIGMNWRGRPEEAWERGFAQAERYAQAHGNLLVPAKYVTPDGFKLGNWISNLRRQRASAKRETSLTEARIQRLDAIGMQWNAHDAQWEENYQAASQYYREHGDLLVPSTYKTEAGFALGAWIRNLRQARSGVSAYRPLTEEQIRRLDRIGMVWSTKYDFRWTKAYQSAQAYYQEHGHLDVPLSYHSPEGIALGEWVYRQRYARANPDKSSSVLTPERIRLLDRLGMVWE